MERKYEMQESKSGLPPSFRVVANVINDIIRTLENMEKKINDQNSRLEKLESELERQIYVHEWASREIYKLKQELDIRKDSQSVEIQKSANQDQLHQQKVDAALFVQESLVIADKLQDNIINPVQIIPTAISDDAIQTSGNKVTPDIAKPIMKGNGFSHITAEYLKSLGKTNN